MARLFITGVNRGIGKALASIARGRGHAVIDATCDGRDDTGKFFRFAAAERSF